jgi:transcriptional regulator with XRE-family HTH domain
VLKKGEQKAFYSQLGKNILEIRKRQNIKQETLATHVGFTRISISNIETGKQKVQIHTLIELAEYLKVPILDLIPSLELVKFEIDSRLEKKISNAEISRNAQAVEKVRDFIRLSTTNTASHVSRKSVSPKNRAKSK